MNIHQITQSQNFEGKFVKVGTFSNKPEYCFNKIGCDLKEIVRLEKFNLYVKQDYRKNNINFIPQSVYPFNAKKTEIQVDLPITSSTSNYLNSAKKAVSDYKKYLSEKEEQAYLKENRKRANKDFFMFMMSLPIILTEMISETLVPGSAEKVEKFFVKIMNKLTKKG